MKLVQSTNGKFIQNTASKFKLLPQNVTLQNPEGGGLGDMLKSVYDPNEVEADIFDVDNHVSGTTNKVFTAAEQTKLTGIEASAVALATVKADTDIDDAIDKKHAHSNSDALDDVSGVNTGDQDLSGYSLTSHNHNLNDLTEKSYNSLSDKPSIPSALSELSDDTTHRIVTDAEKSTWNGKQDALTNPELQGNRVSTFQATPDDSHYPTEKLVKDSLDGKQASGSYEVTTNKKTSLTDDSDTYYPSQKCVKTAVDAKQATLVSGTNIKTINSTSLLGSGDIVIEGGTGSEYMISDFRKNNQMLANAYGLTYADENIQTVTLSTNNNAVHGSIIAKGKLFATTVTTPARIIRFNNLNDLTDYDVLTFAADGKHDQAPDLIYDSGKDRIYVIFTDADYFTVSEIDPGHAAWDTYTDVVADGTRTIVGWGSICCDGSYLYIANCGTSIYKVNLSTFAVTTGTISHGNGHCIRYDGTNLYVTSSASPGVIAKVNPATMTETAHAHFATGYNTPTDDFAFAGDYIWVGCEVNKNSLLKIKKSDLSIEYISTGTVDSTCYGTFFDGKYIWAALDIANKLLRIDPQTHDGYYFATSDTTPNEILSDGQRLFIFYYQSPSKVQRLIIPALTTVGLLRQLTSVYFASELDNGNSGAAKTINFANSQKQKVTIDQATTLTLQFPGCGNYQLKIINASTNLTLSPVPLWSGAIAPTWSTTGTDILSLYYDGTTVYGMAGIGFA